MGYFSRLDAFVNDILTSKLSTEQQATVLSELLLHVHYMADRCMLEELLSRNVIPEQNYTANEMQANSDAGFYWTATRINKLLKDTGIEWEGTGMNESDPAIAAALRHFEANHRGAA